MSGDAKTPVLSNISQANCVSGRLESRTAKSLTNYGAMATPPSSSSESSLLAFSYDRGFDDVFYPHGHDQSQPQTPAATSAVGLNNHNNVPQHSLDPSGLFQSGRPTTGADEEEYELGAETGKRGRGSEDIDPFTRGELVMMSCSSLLVVALICVAIMLTLGKIVL